MKTNLLTFKTTFILFALLFSLSFATRAQTAKTINNLTVKELVEMKVDMLTYFFALDKKETQKAVVLLTERYTALKAKLDTTKTDEQNGLAFKAILSESSAKLQAEIVQPAIDITANKTVKLVADLVKLSPEQQVQLLLNVKPIFEDAVALFAKADNSGLMVNDDQSLEAFKTSVKTHLKPAFKDLLAAIIEQKAKEEAEPFIKLLKLPEPQHKTLIEIIAEKIKGTIENHLIYPDKSDAKDANSKLNSELKEKINTEFLTDEYVEMQVDKIVSLFRLSKQKKDTLTSIIGDQVADLRANKKQYGETPDILKVKNNESKRKSIHRIDVGLLNDVVETNTKKLIDLLNAFAKMDDKIKDTTTVLTSIYFKTVKTLYLENGEQEDVFKDKFLKASSQFAIMICTDVLLKIIENAAADKAKTYIKMLGLSDIQSTVMSIILVQQVKGMLINTIAYNSDKELQKQKNKELNTFSVYRMKTEVLTEGQRKKLSLIGI